MLHAGGVLHDAIMLRQTPSQVRAVFAPKHAGAANMLWVSTRICSATISASLRRPAHARTFGTACTRTHDNPAYVAEFVTMTALIFLNRHAHWRQASSCMPVETYLLFSSVAALTGPSGSASYAAANAAMDAAAEGCSMQGRQLRHS